MEQKDFEETLIRVLQQGRSIDDETHNSHHQWISSELDRRAKNGERLEKFKLSIIGTIGTVFVGGFAWVGKVIWDALQRGN